MTGRPIQDLGGLHIMTAEDIPRFAACTAEAYRGHPLSDHLFDPAYNPSAVETIFGASMRCSRGLLGVSDTAAADAVALFLPPGAKGPSTAGFLAHGGLGLLVSAGLGTVRRLSAYESYCKEVMGRHTDGDTWYLFNLCVRPECQGKGLSSKVMRPVLEHIGDRGQRCYLETQKGSNVGLYEHLGFEVAEKGTVPGSDIPHFAMVWESGRR